MNKIIGSLFIGLLSCSFMAMAPVHDNKRVEQQVTANEIQPQEEIIYAGPYVDIADGFDPSGTVTMDVKSVMTFFWRKTLEIKVTNTTGIKIAYGWAAYSAHIITDKEDKTCGSGFLDGAHYNLKPGTTTIHVPVEYKGKLQSVELYGVRATTKNGLPTEAIKYQVVDNSIDTLPTYSGEAIVIGVGVAIIGAIVLVGFLLSKRNSNHPLRNMGAVMLAGVPICWVLGVVLSLIFGAIGGFGEIPECMQVVPYAIAISLVQILVIPVAFILIAIGKKRG